MRSPAIVLGCCIFVMLTRLDRGCISTGLVESSLNIRIDKPHLDQSAFKVTADLIVENKSSTPISHVHCSAWQSPHCPNTNWGAGILSIPEMKGSEGVRTSITFVSGQMQFDRIFRQEYDSTLRILCTSKSSSGNSTQSRVEYVLDPETAIYVQTSRDQGSTIDVKSVVDRGPKECAGGVAAMIPLDRPGGSQAEASERWGDMARGSIEARTLRSRWHEDPVKRDRVLAALQGTNRQALTDLVHKTDRGQSDLRGLSCLDCKISEIDLADVDLSYAAIEGTIESTDLSRARLFATSFGGSLVYSTWFTEAQLLGARFSGSKIVSANFDRADLYAADFSDAPYIGGLTSFDESCLTGASFDRSRIEVPWWQSVGLRHTSWNQAIVAQTIFRSCDLSFARISEATVEHVAFADMNTMDLATMAEVDLSRGSVNVDSIDVEAALSGDEVAHDRSRFINILYRLAAKAEEVGNRELIDLFYFNRKRLELQHADVGLRWCWEWFRGKVSGWGTRPGNALGWFAMLSAASGVVYGIASVVGRRRHGLFSEDQVLPVTFRRPWEPMVKYVVRIVRDVMVFSVAIASQVGFQNGGVNGAVAVALLGGDRAIEARGFARRVAAAEWLVGKILIFLLLEGLVKQYWT